MSPLDWAAAVVVGLCAIALVVTFLAYLAGLGFFTGKFTAIRRAFKRKDKERKHG